MSEMMDEYIERQMKDTRYKMESLYRKGVKEGSTLATEGAYEMGMADAWTLIQRTMEMPYKDFASLFDGAECLEDIRKWDIRDIAEAMKVYDKASEEKNAAIREGDEVIDSNGLKAVVTNADTHYHLLYLHNGKTWKAPKGANLLKTGKHYNAVRAYKGDD